MNKKKIKYLVWGCIAATILGWVLVGSGMGIVCGLIVFTFIGEELEKREEGEVIFENLFEKVEVPKILKKEEEDINLLEL